MVMSISTSTMIKCPIQLIKSEDMGGAGLGSAAEHENPLTVVIPSIESIDWTVLEIPDNVV